MQKAKSKLFKNFTVWYIYLSIIVGLENTPPVLSNARWYPNENGF
jgi:hypothetical protein